jgi:hypothetical protein
MAGKLVVRPPQDKVDPVVVALEIQDLEALEALVEVLVALVALVQVDLDKDQRTS